MNKIKEVEKLLYKYRGNEDAETSECTLNHFELAEKIVAVFEVSSLDMFPIISSVINKHFLKEANGWVKFYGNPDMFIADLILALSEKKGLTNDPR